MSDGERVRAAAAQLVEHVAPDGSVVEVVTRAAMRSGALRHRSVYIAIVDGRNRLLVHRRAEWKDVFPGAWDLAFGGVCDVGESFADAAQRELFEEAGVTGVLTDRGPVSFESSDVALVGRLYLCRHDGPFAFNDGEVTATRWVDLDELSSFIATHEIPPDSTFIVTAATLATDRVPRADRDNRAR